MARRKQPAKPPEIQEVWTANYRATHSGGYLTHAWHEGRIRALCGVGVHDHGHGRINTGWKPSCLRCQEILVKRGLLPADHAK